MNSSKADNDINTTDIDSLIEKLKSKDGLDRQHARHALVKIGEPSLDALIKAFETRKEPLHWEVAKALSQIGTPKAARTLIKALEDKEFSVRWMAAEGLIHIGADGLVPLLEALKEDSGSVWLREGSHHVLHDLATKRLVGETERKCILPVLDAVNHLEAETQTHFAAREALEALTAK